MCLFRKLEGLECETLGPKQITDHPSSIKPRSGGVRTLIRGLGPSSFGILFLAERGVQLSTGVNA